MTMHLLPPMYSTTGKRRGRPKFRNAEQARLARELDDSWNELLARHPTKKVKSVKRTLADTYKLGTPPGRETPRYPSLDTGAGSTAPAPTRVYTGDKMVGIGTMHKSNMVPIFSDQEAKDISTMRRG